MIIKKIEINLLNLAKYNPRKDLKPEDIEYQKIKRSIKEFGYVDPIIVNKDMTVIGGNQRLKVLKELDYKKVDCVVLDLDKIKEKALNIALNKIEGEWDLTKLKDLLLEIDTGEIDMDITGFEYSELEEIMTRVYVPEESERDDEVPPIPEEPISKPGQLYKLGEHRLLCGDATNIKDVEKLMNGEKADMIFTDPPYGVAYDTDKAPLGKPKRSLGKVTGDDLPDKEFRILLQKAFKNAFNTIKKDASFYICFGSAKLHLLMPILFKIGYHLSSLIVWYKNQFVLGRSDYHNQMELVVYGWKEEYINEWEAILYGFKGEAKHRWYGGRTQSNVWEIDREYAGSYLHPTMKPVAIITRALNNNTLINNIVQDLFGGSGSTLIACEKMQRKCYMMEVEPKYVDVTIERWEKYTGKKAKLINKLEEVKDGNYRT